MEEYTVGSIAALISGSSVKESPVFEKTEGSKKLKNKKKAYDPFNSDSLIHKKPEPDFATLSGKKRKKKHIMEENSLPKKKKKTVFLGDGWQQKNFGASEVAELSPPEKKKKKKIKSAKLSNDDLEESVVDFRDIMRKLKEKFGEKNVRLGVLEEEERLQNMERPSPAKSLKKAKKSKKIQMEPVEEDVSRFSEEGEVECAKKKNKKNKVGDVGEGNSSLFSRTGCVAHLSEIAESEKGAAENSDEEIDNKRKRNKPAARDPEKEARTVFAGNVPIGVNRVRLRRFFKRFGQVECVRLRSVPVADPRLPKRVSAMKKKYHEERHNTNAYVRYATAEEAEKAVAANGSVLDGLHLRIDWAMARPSTTAEPSEHEGDLKADKDVSAVNQPLERDRKRAVFLGNLPFNAEEEGLRELFEGYGAIEDVRIIRDSHTGIGKGFGYVNFKEAESVAKVLAAGRGAFELHDRVLRVKRCVKKLKLEESKSMNRFKSRSDDRGPGKPFRKSDGKSNKFDDKSRGKLDGSMKERIKRPHSFSGEKKQQSKFKSGKIQKLNPQGLSNKKSFVGIANDPDHKLALDKPEGAGLVKGAFLSRKKGKVKEILRKKRKAGNKQKKKDVLKEILTKHTIRH